ncbi:hypothetical protein BU17DRAFT_93629 [Hysterangium stoloniferum]|nr:hypothetical protein BU17DRAFT_93629 [Hysterangium stoloniferum]
MLNSEPSWGLPDAMDQEEKGSTSTKPKAARAGTSRKQAVNQTLSFVQPLNGAIYQFNLLNEGSSSGAIVFFLVGAVKSEACISSDNPKYRRSHSAAGIAELCPEGSLPTRNKPIASLTDKEHLYQRLSELRGRVFELEKALETAHACVSTEAHPLLSSDTSKRKTLTKRKKAQNGHVDDDEREDSEDSETLDEALGSLNMDMEGHRTRYFGRSACIERLFRYQNSGSLAAPTEASILVSSEVAMIYQSFPFLTLGEATNLIQERIWHHLPPLHRAQALHQNYCRQVYRITDVIPQNGWFEELFTRVYSGAQPANTPLAAFSESGVSVEELAVIFAYFAMGALMDLELTPFNYEAEAYACLSRSALTTINVLQNATITTIETLVLLGYFEAMWGEIIGSGDAWAVTGLATKLAESIGLHRNSMKFGLQPIDVERRSKVYWELYVLELLECLSHGRPSTFSLVPADVTFPTCSDPNTDFHHFRYRFAAECLTPLTKQAFGLKMPAYASIIELDRKIRKICSDFGVGVLGNQTISYGGMDESTSMQHYVKLVFRESALLYLHRSFFARAITTNPLDPQHTKYGLSVSGAYESAMTLIQALGELYLNHPASSSRALLCWSHTLCSVFILGTITTRCPGSRLAPLAAKRLHDIDELYKLASAYGGRASADGPIVSRMTEKSQAAAQAYTVEHSRPSRGLTKASLNAVHDITKQELDEEGDDDLALLGGYTRVIKPPRSTASPASSLGLVHSNNSPAQRIASPGTTDTGSTSDSGAFVADLPEFRNRSRMEDHGASSVGDLTDYHISSGGSVSSGMSPLPSTNTTFQQDTSSYHDQSMKAVEPSHSEVEMHYRGVPGYEYAPNMSIQSMGITGQNGDGVRFVASTDMHQAPTRNGRHSNDYAPMQVSANGDSQEWNFLDDWYGHVFTLDVIPPDYGQTAT